MRCSAVATTHRRTTPCWTPGRASRRRSTGPWPPRLAWPGRPVNADFACSASRPATRSSSMVARVAWEPSRCRWRWPEKRGVIASTSEANQDYLREIGAIPVRYGQGVADRVRAAAGGRVDAVFDVAGKTPIEELIRLVSEPSEVLSIANFTAAQAGAPVTGGDADSSLMQALAEVAGLLAQNKLVIKVQTYPFGRAARPTASVRAATSAESSS
jgi:hypothetical protein